MGLVSRPCQRPLHWLLECPETTVVSLAPPVPLPAVSCFVHRHRLFGAEAVHSLDVCAVQDISVLVSG